MLPKQRDVPDAWKPGRGARTTVPQDRATPGPGTQPQDQTTHAGLQCERRGRGPRAAGTARVKDPALCWRPVTPAHVKPDTTAATPPPGAPQAGGCCGFGRLSPGRAPGGSAVRPGSPNPHREMAVGGPETPPRTSWWHIQLGPPGPHGASPARTEARGPHGAGPSVSGGAARTGGAGHCGPRAGRPPGLPRRQGVPPSLGREGAAAGAAGPGRRPYRARTWAGPERRPRRRDLELENWKHRQSKYR